MKEIFDLSEQSWIERRLLPRIPYIKSSFGHVIPKGFDSYCKILTSLFEDLDISDEMRTWADVKHDVHDAEFQKLRARNIVYGVNFHGKRILHLQIAKKHGIPYTHQIYNALFYELYERKWPVRLVGTREGEMDIETANNLSRVLTQFAKDDKYFFSYCDYKKGLRILEGNLTDGLITIGADKYVPGNHLYWWAVDKSWRISVNCDSDFCLCGASFDVINALLNAPQLECFDININDEYC